MRYGAKTVTRFGPYFRRYAVSLRRGQARGGWTSQGFRFGRLTANTTTGKYTFNTPGAGSVHGNIPTWIMQALPRFLTKKPGETR